MEEGCQGKNARLPGAGPARGWELVIPNPKLKLMDQVREVLRIKHYAIRTEQAAESANDFVHKLKICIKSHPQATSMRHQSHPKACC